MAIIILKKIRSKIYGLLRWSEKYTKTDMVYLAGGGSWLVLGQWVATVSSILLAIAFANLLPQEVYGTYKYILKIFGILTIPTLPGINTVVVQAIARQYEGSLIPAIKTKIRWGVLGSVASLALSLYYYLNGNSELAVSFLVVSMFVPIVDTLGLFNSYLQGKKLFGSAIKYFSITQITSISSLIITIFLTDKLFFILLAYFVPLTLIRFILLKRTLKKFPPNEKVEPKTISHGKHLSLVGIISKVATHLDGLLIFHYLGAVEVAIYTFAMAPIEQIRGLYKNIPPLSLPRLAKRSFREIDSIIYKRLFQLLLLGGLIAVVYVLLVPLFFKLLFPKYLESIPFARLAAIILVLRLPMYLFNAVTQSKITYMPKKWLYWAAVPQAALIALLFFLTPLYGINGVVISKIIFLLISFVISMAQWKVLVKRNK